MSLRFPDQVRVTQVSRSEAFNAETEDTPGTLTEAYVEIDSRIMYGNDGAPIEPAMIILLPRTVLIDKGDYVEVTKLHGTDPTTDEAQRRLVKRAQRVGGSRVSHIEVMV